MKILHLYYDSMNLYGDYANVLVLKKHLNDQGINVTVDNRRNCQNIDFNDYDFIYIGSGTERVKALVLKDLMTVKDKFIKAIEANKVILLTGNAMELVSKENLDILDISVTETDKRYTGDVIASNLEIGEVIGFINKCSIISSNEESLFEIIYKDNNLDYISNEGYRYKNLFGTHIIGPILVKNPNMMKYIIQQIDKDLVYKDIDYNYETNSYNIAYHELKKRNKA